MVGSVKGSRGEGGGVPMYQRPESKKPKSIRTIKTILSFFHGLSNDFPLGPMTSPSDTEKNAPFSFSFSPNGLFFWNIIGNYFKLNCKIQNKTTSKY